MLKLLAITTLNLLFLPQMSRDFEAPSTSSLIWELADAATSPDFGDAFFINMVKRLAEAFRVRYALVGECLDGNPNLIFTKAVWAKGELASNFSYALHGTPCEKILGKTLCWYEKEVIDLFPEDELLRRLEARSYVGVPLFSSRKEPLGIIVLLHDQPLPEQEQMKAVLRICASRTGGEIERSRMETLLRMSEERLLASIQTTPHVAIQWYDDAGKVRFWNKASEAFFGWSSAEVLGRSLRGMVLSDTTALQFEESIRQVKATGLAVGPVEFEVRRRDGTLGYCESTLFGIPGEGGKLWYVCTAVDVTARRHAETELKTSEEHYRQLIETSPLPMLITDLSQRVLMMNAKFTELFGYTLEDVPSIDYWWVKAYPDEKYRARIQQEWGTRLETAFHTGKPVESIEAEVCCKDGAVRRVHASASFNAGRLLVVFVDLTDRAKLEHELRQAQKLELVGQLAGGVAHDFNNIIQAVLGFIGLAQDAALSHADRDIYLKEALGAAKRASQLTRQLLAFGRRQPMQLEDTHLPDLVNNLLKLLRRLIGEHIDVQLSVGANIGSVHCDRTQIEQVLINLCVNARDAMPSGGKLLISLDNKVITPSYKHIHPWARVGRFLLITVTDTGCGMDRETQERVFEPFFTTKAKDKGTGLGLSVVYGIVRQHEGYIRLYSEVGLGTTFRIYLPVVDVSVQAEQKQDSRSPSSGGTETILVAEDDDTIRNLVRRILERAGYQVILATNGEEAVSLFEANAHRISILVFDAVMPKLSGFEAYERIQRLNSKRIPAVFASGYNEAFSQVGTQMPSDTVLMQKPYDPDELLRNISRLLLGSNSIVS